VKRRLYRFLLWLHPLAFRQRFGAELLWIYDETAAEGYGPLFTDLVGSLFRQWAFHSVLWKLLAGAAISGSLMLLCTYDVTSAFQKPLERNYPPAADIRVRLVVNWSQQAKVKTAAMRIPAPSPEKPLVQQTVRLPTATPESKEHGRALKSASGP
jgi:hypothetical protein